MTSEKFIEEKKELCSVASKLVTVRIYRRKTAASLEGEITGFDCTDRSNTCERKCTYRMLLEDL